jgi:hypothetical protein
MVTDPAFSARKEYMNDELEPEVLSYREFRNRETLLAWQRRWQRHESQPLPRPERHRRALPRLPGEPQAPRAR